MAIQSNREASNPSSTFRVFLAEDDADLRGIIAGALRKDGYIVLEARDGPGLLLDIGHAYWGDLPDPTPTAIVSDFRLPERDGLSILRGLKNYQWCPPFILMTGFGNQDLHEEARRLGAHAVFDKPFELDRLRAAIARLAEGADAVEPIRRRRPRPHS